MKRNSLRGIRNIGLAAGLALIILLTACQKNEVKVTAPDLYPAYVSGADGVKWGYLNHNGKFIIKPQFAAANDFQSNGLAIVQAGEKTGVINTKGEFVIQAEYDGIRPFADGLTYAWQGEQLLLDEAGHHLFSTKGWIGDFSDDLALFAATVEEEYRFGYVNRAGDVVIQPEYINATPFHDGKAVVLLADGGYALIDTEGTVMRKFDYASLGEYGDGRVGFQDDNQRWGYLDETGTVVITPQFDQIEPFADGIAIVNNSYFADANAGVIRPDGRFVIPPEYIRIQRLGEGLLAIGKPLNPEETFLGAKFAIAKADGTFLTDFDYYEVQPFDHGRASVSDRDTTFFIDTNGKTITDLPRVPGSGNLSYDGRLVKAFIDQEVFYLQPNGDPVWQGDPEETLANGVTVTKTKYRPNRNILTYYPVLTGMNDPAVEAAVNEYLKVRYTKVTAPETEDLYYSYTGSFSVAYSAGNLLVLQLLGYDFPFGAAHGTPVQEYFHIDLGTGQFYTLQDLFKPGSDYVQRINAILTLQVEEKGEEMGIFAGEFNGIKPDQPFIVTADGLKLWYGVYEIAPYAAGFPTFTIGYDQIVDQIDTDGALWKAFHE